MDKIPLTSNGYKRLMLVHSLPVILLEFHQIILYGGIIRKKVIFFLLF